MIKAPYNFVPLENRAFYPSWANHISQDIPFEDGVSGSIEYTIEAETPIFVRNGYTDRKDPDTKFSQSPDGKYFIPGTSIKGEIRNVLEILSFGKMTQVQDARFGIRTLGRRDYTNAIQNERCGWLYKDSFGNYKIEDCDKPGVFQTSYLSDSLNQFMRRPYFDATVFNRWNRDNHIKNVLPEEIKRSAMWKYAIYGFSFNDLLTVDFSENIKLNYTFSKTDIPNRNRYDRRELYIRSNNSTKKGTIVLTGQPSGTKKYDFIFFAPTGKTYPVPDNTIADFKSIHRNNIDFQKIWLPRLESNRKVPVFFTMSGDEISAIGLSGMFRIPSKTSIKEAIFQELQIGKHDLAECIFGSTIQTKEIKGRVFFGHAFAEGAIQPMQQVDTTLSSPKPSYGPLYVKQGSWNTQKAVIKGRKRYPVRSETWGNEQGTTNTKCHFIPLPKNTTFTGRISFHNLRECELGALIAALTFNGHPECFHSIGEAKPLGYGKVKISLTSLKIKDIHDNIYSYDDANSLKAMIEKYLKEFDSMMSTANINWSPESQSIKQLIRMAEGIPAKSEDNFKYMEFRMFANELRYPGNTLRSFTDILDNDRH